MAAKISEDDSSGSSFSMISSRCMASSAFSTLYIFFSCGESEVSSNNDAVWDPGDSAPVSGVSASRTSAGSSSHMSSHVAASFGALLDERIRSPGILVGHVAWDGVHLAILLQRATGGDARPTVFGGLNNQHSEGNSADDSIANREILRRGKRSQRELR